jgi:membrane protein DedA with SNARE-associated domain
MGWIPHELRWRTLVSSTSGLSRGSYVVIAVLVGFLIWTSVLAGMGWSSAAGTEVPLSGYFAMALGVVFSLVVGVGLMALVFYSSRAGYDEPARLIESDRNKPEE